MNRATQKYGTLAALAGLLLLAGTNLSLMAQTPEPELSDWECEFCPFPQGSQLGLNAGSGYISDDSFKFGDYRGLDEKGAYFLGDVDYRYWGHKGNYWDVVASDLGLDSRSLKAEGGRRGRYELRVTYDELTKLLFDTTRTPFIGAGGPALTLPAGWVTAGGTGGMTELTNSLTSVPIEHDRDNLGLGLTFHQNSRLQYDVDYRHEERDGTGIHSGNFITLTSLLPEPIDYTTDEFDASVSYVGERGQVSLAYYASTFDSGNPALIWQNPYNPILGAGNMGRSSLPPENEAYQVTLSGNYRIADHTRVTGTASVGKMEQDDLFLPFTISPNIVTMPLPSQSLNGEVDTTKLNVRVDSRPLRKLRLKLSLDYDDRDNGTPRQTYNIVESDTFPDGTRTNLPYSFERADIDFEAGWRIDSNARLGAGFSRETIDRDFQEVAETDEDTGWLKIRLFEGSGWGWASIKLSRASRDGGAYQAPMELETVQNPLLRKFHLADRDRDIAEADFSFDVHERVSLGASVEVASEDYDDSVIGLTEADYEAFALDASVQLFSHSLLSLMYSREEIESSQAGSQAFDAPDWFADANDVIDTFGFALRIPQIAEKADLQLDYTYADSEGETVLNLPGNVIDVFPDLTTRLNSARLFVDYRVNDRYTIRGGYYYEKYVSRDWMLDNVGVATLPNVISLGALSPDYEVSVVGLSFTYSVGNE